jgi:hypothetical protein
MGAQSWWGAPLACIRRSLINYVRITIGSRFGGAAIVVRYTIRRAYRYALRRVGAPFVRQIRLLIIRFEGCLES